MSPIARADNLLPLFKNGPVKPYDADSKQQLLQLTNQLQTSLDVTDILKCCSAFRASRP